MLTDTDMQVIDFITSYKVASIDTIQQFCFNSYRTAQRRLKTLVDCKKLKRVRLYNGKYAYMVKDIKQFTHSLAVTEFYRDFCRVYRVSQFIVEPNYGSIQPDASFVYHENGSAKVGLLEIELSNNKFKSEKYDKFIATAEYRDYLKVKPVVFVVGRSAPRSETVDYKEWKLRFIDRFK